MNGADAFIHGYAARLGFGITLIKNQIVDTMPKKKNNSLLRLTVFSSLFYLEIISFSLGISTKLKF